MKLAYLFTAALVTVVGAPSANAVVEKRPSCPVQAVRTLDAGVSGRVYYRPTREPDRVFLCSYRTGRRVPIGWDDCFNAAGVEHVRFSRRFLAVGFASCSPGGTVATIDVRRAGDGRRLRRLAAAPGVPRRTGDDGVITVDALTDLVGRGDGAVAWIVEVANPAGAPEGSTEIQVRGSTDGRGSVLLASGAGIERGSLALGGSTLYWTQGGTPRSAELGTATTHAYSGTGTRIR